MHKAETSLETESTSQVCHSNIGFTGYFGVKKQGHLWYREKWLEIRESEVIGDFCMCNQTMILKDIIQKINELLSDGKQKS